MYTLLQKFGVAALLVAALLMNTRSVSAQHSDVDFEYHDGMIEVEFGPEGRVFEGDFSDFPSPDETNDPGYGTHSPINPDDIIGFNVLGPLLYHDGLAFASTTATLTIEDVINNLVAIDSSTTSGSGLIGEADSIGVVHSHVDYLINSSAPVGAYGVFLSLSSFDENMQPTGIADSDPFYIVFNRGLTEPVFEGAVEAFAAQVPEPTSLALIGAASAVFGLGRRRRKE